MFTGSKDTADKNRSLGAPTSEEEDEPTIVVRMVQSVVLSF